MALIPVVPVERRGIALGREATPGVATPPTVGVPCEKFGPEDKPTPLIDKSWRQAMATEYGLTQGTTISDWSISGPVYADTLGHFLFNCLGDYTSVGVAATPNTTLTGASNTAGAVALTVTSGTSFTLGMNIQVGTGTSAEIVTVSGAGGATSIPIAGTPLRFTHAAAEAVTNTTPGNGNYTHVFSLLNSGSAQPPAHTLTDISGLGGSFGARQFAFACVSELQLTANASQFLTWDAKGQAFLSTVAAAQPTFNPSTQPAQAAWNSVAGIGGPATGGTLVKYVAEWALTIQRKLDPVWTTQGVQNPYVIARGGVNASLKLMFDAVPSEAPLLALLNNTQPQTQFIATGPNSTSITVDAQVTAYDTAKINDGKAVFGFDVDAKLIGNPTNVGNSPGYSPCKITIVNAVPTY